MTKGNIRVTIEKVSVVTSAVSRKKVETATAQAFSETFLSELRP